MNLYMLLKSAEKKRKCMIFRFPCNHKIWLFCSPELYYITVVVFVAKYVWVFISYTVHRNKLIDIIINNINGVIN